MAKRQVLGIKTSSFRYFNEVTDYLIGFLYITGLPQISLMLICCLAFELEPFTITYAIVIGSSLSPMLSSLARHYHLCYRHWLVTISCTIVIGSSRAPLQSISSPFFPSFHSLVGAFSLLIPQNSSSHLSFYSKIFLLTSYFPIIFHYFIIRKKTLAIFNGMLTIFFLFVQSITAWNLFFRQILRYSLR